jgi:hypothetical protein
MVVVVAVVEMVEMVVVVVAGSWWLQLMVVVVVDQTEQWYRTDSLSVQNIKGDFLLYSKSVLVEHTYFHYK